METSAVTELCRECPGHAACELAEWPGHDASALRAMEFIVGRSEEAIRDGQQLERWLRARGKDFDFFPIELPQTFELPYRAEGFFDCLELNGETISVMGCRQEVELGQIDLKAGPQLLRDFVYSEFLNNATWLSREGVRGGFTVRKCFYKPVGGPAGCFDKSNRHGSIDWRDLGTVFEWVLHTVYLHDFVVDIGPYEKHFAQSIGFVAHPSFVHDVENPDEDTLLEVTVGYPFAGYAPIPNFFGFGPGKFSAAVQYFTFLISKKGYLKVHMVFAAAPRCEKVLDFGKNIPDPIYGGAALVNYLTFGIMNPAWFHDKLDAGMLAQHCRVHEAFIDGVGRNWKRWLAQRA